jgi:hypothetical protein
MSPGQVGLLVFGAVVRLNLIVALHVIVLGREILEVVADASFSFSE